MDEQNMQEIFNRCVSGGSSGLHFPPPIQSEEASVFNEMRSDGYSENVIMHAKAYAHICPESPANAGAAVSVLLSYVPCVALDEGARRMRKRSNRYPKLESELYQRKMDSMSSVCNGRSHSAKKRKKITTQYKQTLKEILNLLRENEFIVDKTDEAFSSQSRNIEYHNRMFNVYPCLYGILECGCFDDLSSSRISDTTWMSAIELTFTLRGLTAREIYEIKDFLDDSDFMEFFSQNWPTIVAFALLIHNLHLFTSEENLQRLYEASYDPQKTSNERKDLLKQIDALTFQAKADKDEISRLKAQLKSQQQRSSSTPQKDKAIAELNHAHNAQLREKDEEIQRLKERIEQLECEHAELETTALHQAQTTFQDKPWLNIELPEERILFVGGHINLVNKLREIHPKWRYLSTTDTSTTIPTSIDAILVWSNHLSHDVWFRLNNAYKSREKILYIHSTNLTQMEEEIKWAIWNRQQSEKGA